MEEPIHHSIHPDPPLVEGFLPGAKAEKQYPPKRLTEEALAELSISVTPAKAGVQKSLKGLDSGFRRNDAQGLLQEARRIRIKDAWVGLKALAVPEALCYESVLRRLDKQSAPSPGWALSVRNRPEASG